MELLTGVVDPTSGPEGDRNPVEAANIVIPAADTAHDYTIDLE